MKSNESFLSQLKPARQQLEVWRRTRKRGERIPEQLWTALVALTRVHGVSPVSQALRLDYYALKRRVLEAEPLRRSHRKTVAPFVELPLIGPTPSSARCTVELAKNSVHYSFACPRLISGNSFGLVWPSRNQTLNRESGRTAPEEGKKQPSNHPMVFNPSPPADAGPAGGSIYKYATDAAETRCLIV